MRKVKHFKLYSVLIGIGMLAMVSCMKSSKFEEEEKLKIDTYLGNNPNLHFELKSSGLYYLNIEEGEGTAPVSGDSVWFFYTGKFLSGMVFDSNVTNSSPMGVLYDRGDLILGIDEALGYMKPGGKSLALIPSSLGYGSTGDYYGYISGYTPLLFDIELVRIKHNTGK